MSSAETCPIFTAKLKSREESAERTMAFHFEKPVAWAFKAGQFIDMTLLNPSQTDPEGNKRGFSIASAPQEETLMVATRLRDTAFKRVLKAMPLETVVKIEGPFGNLTPHNNAKRTAVLLSGGIGITPFRSIRSVRQKRNFLIGSFSSTRIGDQRTRHSSKSFKPCKKGSERESEKSMISRGFPQDEKFGFQGCHSLGFQ